MRTFVAALVFATANAGQSESCGAYKIIFPQDDYSENYNLVCDPAKYDAGLACEAFKDDTSTADPSY